MKATPFILFVALCLCLCACSSPSEKADLEEGSIYMELNVYSGDESCENIISEPVEIPELSPEYIMDALYQKGVLNEAVAVNSFMMDKTGVIRLDLSGNFGSMINSMGSSGEYIMMGSLVNTFLDAYNASGLILLVDGQVLESGHSIYDWTMEFFPSIQ